MMLQIVAHRPTFMGTKIVRIHSMLYVMYDVLFRETGEMKAAEFLRDLGNEGVLTVVREPLLERR